MHVATLLLYLRLDGCETPRQRRRAVQAMTRKLREHFNVSLADLGPESPPAVVQLAVAAVGRSRREAREPLDHVADAVAAHPRAVIVQPPKIEDL